MKRLLTTALFCTFAVSLHGQTVDATVCDILEKPQSFNGKIVRIKGTVSSGFDEFVIKADDCKHHIDSIWLSYPEGTKAKSGPVALLQLQPARDFSGTVTPVDRAPVTLDNKSKEFKQFDSLLATPYKGGGVCLGCTKYEVSATLTGRLDFVVPALQRDASGKISAISGFGNLNAWSTRLVLQSVSDIAPHEIDYSKVTAITKSEANTEAGGDSTAAVHTFAKAFGANNALGNQVERAAAAFGKPGDDNGVNVGFSGMNEASPRLEQKSDHASPDGVLYHCTFDSNRLKGNAMAFAVAHVGEHIADLRDTQNAPATLYSLENRAWVTTALAAVGARQKTLTTPGGYMIWNAAWPPADINKLSSDALGEFLKNEARLM
jgi:hypothetical protein